MEEITQGEGNGVGENKYMSQKFGLIDKTVEITIKICSACNQQANEEIRWEAVMETKDGIQTGNVEVLYYSRCDRCNEYFEEKPEMTKIMTESEFDWFERENKTCGECGVPTYKCECN